MSTKLAGIARLLVSRKLIGETAMGRAVDDVIAQGGSLIQHLVSNRLIDPRPIAETLSNEFQLPLIAIDTFDLSYCPENIIDSKLIRKHRMLPLAVRDKVLFLSVSDPGRQEALDELAFHSGLKIEPVLAEHGLLDTVIDSFLRRVGRSYSAQPAADAGREEEASLETAAHVREDEEFDGLDETPLMRFIDKLLLEAVTLRASDIHFEPYESAYRVRFRIDGLLQEMTRPPVNLSARLASRIKIMARLDIAEKRKPQDGRIRLRLAPEQTVDFRVNSLPTLWGEKIVMRVLDPMNTSLDLDTLGMETQQRELYTQALRRHQGLILVTGPTGSGKSHTLYCGLSSLNVPTKNIATVEDPVEITIDGINQLAINAKTGLSFASALRATLRQDPDIIMLGEIRDLESAETVLRAAQTGHLVLSTLHTLSAAASLNRLRDMGVPRYNLAGTISLVIAQRLARRLCERCKEGVELPDRILKEQGFDLELQGQPRLYRPRACSECRDGYNGRIAFYEVVPVSEGLSRIIMSDGQSQQLAAHMAEQGLATLREAALQKVAVGLTSLEEANRLT